MLNEDKESNDNVSITENQIASKTLKKKRKNMNNKSIKNIKKTSTEEIIEYFIIDKSFDFAKYNLNYSWKDEDFITQFTKKKNRQKRYI